MKSLSCWLLTLPHCFAELVEELLGKGVPVDSTDDEGNTALLLAAEGEPEIVDICLKHGANVNHQNSEGLSALMCAVKYEDEAIITLLVEAVRRNSEERIRRLWA
jgi:ankyrin repeat protein